VTSLVDETRGRHMKYVDSVGEYVGCVEGLWKKGRSSTKVTSREMREYVDCVDGLWKKGWSSTKVTSREMRMRRDEAS
jgi:hypothetical protein